MYLRLISITLLGLATLAACGGGSGGQPTTGTLELTVVEEGTNAGLANARVIVVDGTTGESVDLLATDANGKVSKVYDVGTLQLQVSSQNYAPTPPPGIPP